MTKQVNPTSLLGHQQTVRAAHLLVQLAPLRGVLVAIRDDGMLQVRACGDLLIDCDVLEGALASPLSVGDAVLVGLMGDGTAAIVLGRIGRYTPTSPQKSLTLEATESLTLKCGDASVDLRADGKVMVRGDDVLIRAKGTQRIRAGNVAIN